MDKLERLYPETEYVDPLTTHQSGQRVTRFHDLDGNLIESGGHRHKVEFDGTAIKNAIGGTKRLKCRHCWQSYN